MEYYLLVRQFWDLFYQIQQEFLQVLVVCQEKTEKLIRFLKCYYRQLLKIFHIKIELLENIALIRSKNIISFFAPDYLTDGMWFDQHFDELDSLFALKFHEILTKLDNKLLLLLERNFDPDVLKGMLVILFILN